MEELTTDGLPLNLFWPLATQLQPNVDAMLEILAGSLQVELDHTSLR